MALRLNGSSSGYVELDAPAVAASNTLTLPNGNGTSGQYLQTNGSGGLSWQTVTDTVGAQWTTGSTQTLSGTSFVFSSIPSNVIYIRITYDDVSFNGNTDLNVRIGDSGGLETSGYVGRSYATSSVMNMVTDAFGFAFTAAAAYQYSGSIELWKHSGNTWFSEARSGMQTVPDYMGYIGKKTLSDTLTQVQLKGANGTSSFDSGTATLHYFTA